MNPEQVEKAAEKYRMDTLHYHDSDGVDVAEVYKAGASLVLERCKRLENALKEIVKGDWKFHQEGGALDGPFAKIARAALEGKES